MDRPYSSVRFATRFGRLSQVRRRRGGPLARAVARHIGVTVDLVA
jgi:hypothetical protein